MTEDLLSELGALALGSRLRRLSDQLMQDGILVYRDSRVEFEPKWFPVYAFLQHNGPSAVMTISRGLGISHASVNQVGREMMAVALVAAYKDRRDKRRRVLALTSLGKEKFVSLEPVWKDISAALEGIINDAGIDFLAALEAMENSVARQGFRERYSARRLDSPASLEVVTFVDKLAPDFSRLNEDWINEYFEMEAADRRTLDNPRSAIVDTGGEVVFVIDRDMAGGRTVLGTCAIVRKDDAVCELAKMAVSKSARGRGIGRIIGHETIRIATEMGFSKMFLETNSILKPALALYRSLGFKQMAPPFESDYGRADVYMELTL